MTKVLLKGRPTPVQLADRLAPPVPEGLELYLDAGDISGSGWFDKLLANIGRARCPQEFSWIVEGPLRSLDGRFFDITEPSEANLEVVNRLVQVAGALGAAGVVIHAIAPVSSTLELSMEGRQRALDAGMGFLRQYAGQCLEAGLVPSIENIPPVARMRERSYTYSLLGVDPEDLLLFAREIKGLRAVLDISHCGLFLNALSMPAGMVEKELSPLLGWLQGQSSVRGMDECITGLHPILWNCHISNARGLLEEGLPYADGDNDIDRLLPLLAQAAEFLVTETLEPDSENAVYMREAQRRIKAVLNQLGAGQGRPEA